MIESCLGICFFKTSNGLEPVRSWLQSLTTQERKSIGTDIKTVQFGWPLGMPLVKKMADGLWEIRTHLPDKIVRVFFTVVGQTIFLLHGFMKKSQATPEKELTIAKTRLKQLRNSL